jgi:hypothetical protein
MERPTRAPTQSSRAGEVGTRFAEPHDILSPHLLFNLEIPKQNVGTIPKTRFNFQDWRINICAGSQLSMQRI